MRLPTAEIMERAREQAMVLLEELKRRPLVSMPPGMLIDHFKVLANFGGLPPADKAWEAAMHTLASQHCSDEVKRMILEQLAGMAGARKEIE